MAKEVLKNVLDWCFKKTNILNAKDSANNEERLNRLFKQNLRIWKIVTNALDLGMEPQLFNREDILNFVKIAASW